MNGSFQYVSKSLSFQLKEELKRKVWDSLESNGETCSAANANNIATRYKDTQSPSPESDVHKVLLLFMLRFCGVVVLIRKDHQSVCRTL